MTPEQPHPEPEYACGKIRWPSRRVALEHVRRHMLKLHLRGKRAVLNVYHCPDCGGWHAGNADAGRPRSAGRPKPPPPDVGDYEEGAA